MKKYKIAFLGAGNIARVMAATISQMPQIEAYAVAARDFSRAKAFAAAHGFQKAFGSYEEMLKDPQIDLVYISTPHSHHYEHAMLCLEHGKKVLCEKAFTANAKQAQKLLTYAKSRRLLITEAIWTRYMPLSKKINQLIDNGIIGKVTLLTANLGYMETNIERVMNPDLAGGALLDISIYPINFASMVFGPQISKVTSTCVFTDTGVDAMDSITLCYEDGKMAVLNTTILSRTNREGIIYGDQGYMVVENINNPERVRIFSADQKEIAVYEAPEKITGYEYEVLAAIGAIEEGRLECAEMPHHETLRIMKLLDGIRESWGIKFPFE